MSGAGVLVAVIVVLAVAYQIYVSRRVACAPDYTTQQRLWQLIMIWVLPVVGAALCHLMLNEADSTRPVQTQSDSEDSAGGNGSHHANADGD